MTPRCYCTSIASLWVTLLLVLPPPVRLRQLGERQRTASAEAGSIGRWLDSISGDANQEESTGCSGVGREASQWISEADSRLGELWHTLTTANWNYQTNLTEYNAEQLGQAQTALDDWTADALPTARQYLKQRDEICNATTVRLLERFVYSNPVPVANNPHTRKLVNRLATSMEEIYSTATVTDDSGQVYRLDPELTNLMSNSRDYDRLQWAWEAWHDATGPRMKSKYAELVEKMNEGARDNGFADVGIAWQVTDFEESDVEVMMDRLYLAIRPFYQQLHAYVRHKLISAYPNRGISSRGPIPVHLLGDMWAQQWDSVMDLMTPYPNAASINVTDALLKANFSVLSMFRTSEEFYTSIGLEPMTNDFWTKSVIVRPNDNIQMTCHGSAEDFSTQTDFRIKMCTQVNQVDFDTVHHEMGHVEYFMQYRHQPIIFRNGANAAFHEAIGDTISLSVMTTKHLKTIGLIGENSASTASSRMQYETDINFLMKMALNKIAFIPFAYVMDKWRYRVFRGDVRPEQYNIDWWRLRRRYQGLIPPTPRPIDGFDAGSKYHIPANVPYSRYFFSFIGQFQFHASLCKLSGHRGPLHTCDIYRSTAAGDRLKSVLSLGASRPWREALDVFTGQREFSVGAILEYFRPLIDWLKRENAGRRIGW